METWFGIIVVSLASGNMVCKECFLARPPFWKHRLETMFPGLSTVEKHDQETMFLFCPHMRPTTFLFFQELNYMYMFFFSL